MKTLREILDSLPDEKRRQLHYAFEHGFAQYVETTSGEYVGVNVETIKFLRPQQQAGTWSSGEIVR